MTARNMIQEQVKKNGMTLKELSRRTGIPYHRVRKAIGGESKIMAYDFLAYCKVLNFDIK